MSNNHFMIKALKKLAIEVKYFITNAMLSGESLKTFSPKSGMKQNVPTLMEMLF